MPDGGAADGFYVLPCADNVQIIHGSLGVVVPEIIKAPLVVYLKKRPRKVFAQWSMAQ